MKLRINAKLKAALIAAISTVGFTLSQADAVSIQASETWTIPHNVPTSSPSILTIAGESLDMSSVWCNRSPNGNPGVSSVFAPGVNIGNGDTWTLTFNIENTTDHAITLNSLILDVSMYQASGGAQTRGTVRTVDFKLMTGSDTLAELDIIMQGVGDVAQPGVIYDSGDAIPVLTFASGVTIEAGASQNFALITAKGSSTDAEYVKGCCYGLIDLVANYTYEGVLPTWNGTTEHNTWSDADSWSSPVTAGADVVFDGTAEYLTATVDADTTASSISVNASGKKHTFDLAHNLTTGKLDVAANSTLALDGSGTMTVTGELTCDGLLDIASGTTLKVDNASQAKALMLSNGKVANKGTVVIGDNVTLDSSATTTMTGTLAVAAGKKLIIGTNKDNQSYDFTSLDALVLGQGANIDTKALKVDIKNLTANGSTIKMLDTKDKDQVGVDLKGTTTLDGNLTITSDWKYKVNIEKLAGEGNLILTGGWEEHRAVIGDADINSISVAAAMTETWLNGTVKLSDTLDLNGGTTYAGENGSLTVGGLTGTAALAAANGITFTGAGEYTYTGTLTAGGQIVKQGTGSQTITGTALYRTIDVQAGTLVLNGEYSIDGIETVGDNHFVDTAGASSTSGFLYQAGTKTVYTVADDAHITTTGATFKFNDATVQLEDGKYAVDPTTDYTTLWVNGGTLSYDAYYTASQEALTTAKVASGATLEVGEHAVGTLEYQTNGSTINLSGTGTVNAISGTGILNMAADARVSVPDVTVSNDRGIYSTGAGTLVMNALYVDNNASRVEFDSATKIALIEHTGGTITFGGVGNTHSVTDLKLSMRGGRASTVNVAAGATLHITGTEIATAGGGGSFAVSHWNSGGNTINVNGTLISEAIISGWDGEATINVENGGTLELRAGLNRNDARNNAINLNIKSGATLVAGTATTGTDKDSLHVNLNDGSTFKGYYGAGDTATIARAITFGSGTVTIDVESGKTLQLDSNIAGEGVAIAKTGAGALVLNGNANVLYNAINVQAGTLALNGTFDLSHITHEQGTVKYFKDDQPGTVESDNGFAKYVGEVQLVNGLTENVTQGASATLTLDGYNVTYDDATGKAVSSDISLGTYYINTGSETLSEIQQVSPTAGVAMKGGTTLVADANFSGSLTVTGDGNGKLVISKDKLVSATAPNQALELSGEGTYTLGSTLSLGNVTLGDDWTGIVRVTDYTPNNAQNIGAVVRGTNSTVELMGFKGWDNNWNGTVNYNVKLTNGSDGYAWQNGAFGGGQQTETFTGTWSGDGMFQVVGATGDRTMHYTYSGNIKDWTGEFQKDGKQVTNLTFTGSAKDVNITISHVAGAAALNVIADAEGIVFSKGVAANAFTANVATTLKGETTIGSLSGAGALTVDAGENTVTVNGISGLANTITLTSGSLSLNGTVDISNDMPVTDGGVYYIGGQDTDNGFKTVEGKLQVVDIAAGAHLIEGEGISYRLGGEEIATALDNGAILVEPTTTYGTFYVNKAGTTESIANAIRVATEAGSTLTAVVMSADTTLAANAEATYSLALAADASATVDVTAATTISSLTGPVAGKTLTVTGSNAITIQSASDFEGNVSITGATVKLGSQTALGKYNTDTAKVITIGAGGTVDTNGQIDANYNYVLAGGTLTNTGDGKNVNNSQTTGLTLTANSYIGSEGQNEMWVARRSHAANTIELGGFTLTKNGAGLFGFKNSAITAGTLQVNAGTVKLEGGSIAANVVLNGGALTGTLTPSADINVTAQKSVTIGSDLAFSIAEGKTVTLKTAEEQAITFSTAFAHANGKLAAAGTVNFNQGLTPNSGTVEVSGTVNVSGKSLDLSSGGNSTGKLNVTGTGVLNVNNGMWMNTTAIDIAEGGTMNIAGLHIVGEADGATIATTAGNQNYGTNNDKYVITNAAVTGTTNINLGNKLVNSTLTTGAYTMTLNNAASTYDAVYVSTGGTLVVNADIDLAGVLHSSGAITVNEEKSLTLAEGSSLYQTITNSGTVSLTGVTLGDGFSEQTEGSAYYDINGNATTEDQNHYVGSATTYVQVVDGGTSSGTGIVWNEKSYDLSENTGRIIVGQGGVDYGTFYMMDGTVELSKLNADTKGVEVKGGTLVVDKSASGIDITVTNDGTITGDEAMPEDVKIASLATAKFTQDVAGTGYEFKTGDAQQGESDNVTIKNFGEDAAYSAENPLMMVSAQTLEMTDVENDATVTNMVWVSEIVNETGHKLTLENADSLALESMTIGEGSTVQVLYDLDEQTTAEGMVSITESLVAGGGTLLADLTIIGNEQGTTMWALQGTAMTLGSEFTLDVTQSLINLDDATIAALDGLSVGDSMEFITAAQNTGLTYGGDGYEGMWYDGLFVRTDALQGDYRVYANEQGFGLTKVSKTPEPTTGILSLLALAALAARRRKH